MSALCTPIRAPYAFDDHTMMPLFIIDYRYCLMPLARFAMLMTCH